MESGVGKAALPSVTSLLTCLTLKGESLVSFASGQVFLHHMSSQDLATGRIRFSGKNQRERWSFLGCFQKRHPRHLQV